MLCRVDCQRSCSSKAKYPAPFPRIQRPRQNCPDSEASGCLHRCFVVVDWYAKSHTADSRYSSPREAELPNRPRHVPILGRDTCRPEILLHHRPGTMLKHLDAILVAAQLLMARRRKFAVHPRHQVRLPTCQPKAQGRFTPILRRKALRQTVLFKGFLLRRSEILLVLSLLFFRAPPMITTIHGSQRDIHCILMWHRMFEALSAGRPLQGLYLRTLHGDATLR